MAQPWKLKTKTQKHKEKKSKKKKKSKELVRHQQADQLCIEEKMTRKFIQRNNGWKLPKSEEGNGFRDPRSPKKSQRKGTQRNPQWDKLRLNCQKSNQRQNFESRRKRQFVMYKGITWTSQQKLCRSEGSGMKYSKC